MRKTLLLSFLFIGLNASAQNFGIPIKDHPFFRIIEWKGKGGLLMSRNPKEFMNQINLTLVAEKEEGMWDQKFNPRVREPFYLFNENTRHVYFINNLDLIDNGRASFSQMSSAGNVKSKILDVGIKVKALKTGFDYNDFEFLDAAVTMKTLNYHYRYYDKKEKEYHEYAVFMTHHNLQCVITELGISDSKEVQAGKLGQWMFCGFEGETSFFAYRERKADVNGYTIKGYSTKAVVVEDHFLKEPENVHLFRNIGYGNTGKYYQEDKKRNVMETGIVSCMDGEYYLTSIQDRDGGSEIVLQKRIGEDGDQWEELNSVKLDPFNVKEEVQFGAFPVKEGITYRYKHNGIDKVGILLFEKGKEGYEEPFTAHSVYNPSRLLIEHTDNEFVTAVPGKIVECDMNQFQRSGGINFVHREGKLEE